MKNCQTSPVLLFLKNYLLWLFSSPLIFFFKIRTKALLLQPFSPHLLNFVQKMGNELNSFMTEAFII